MDSARFTSYCHKAIHELIELNEKCERDFHISSWPRYDYDMDKGTLTFSEDGSPKVVALIQVVGSTSRSSCTWLWSWANQNIPNCVTSLLARVRAFGEAENLAELTQANTRDEEDLGWKMTAISAKVLGAKGAYRCPGENGFIYFVYSSLRFVDQKTLAEREPVVVKCETHGSGYETFVCQHLASNPKQEWFPECPSDTNQWPDAWCALCDKYFQEEGQWNEKNSPKLKVRLLCHRCYEKLREHGKPHVEGL